MFFTTLSFVSLIGLSLAVPPMSGTPTRPESECQTICADFLNECGYMYGGCFPDPRCTGGTAWPTFTPPPCPTTTSKPTPTCTVSLCIDNIDECGQMWGGCTLAPQCGGPKSPSFTRPSCSLTTKTPTVTATITKVVKTKVVNAYTKKA
ncbi:hypothetical protein BZA77DRAFT_315105 [Pyronema omphalodes]|nr:hypothetical protein BZA77DRAFT_315105 [Pyronema omphalodes]